MFGTSRGDTPLHEAAWAGRLATLQELLAAASLSVDARDHQGWTCLHLAAVRGFPVIALALLQHGTDVGARDLMGRTPLHFTARSGSVAVAQHLLDNGAAVGAQDSSGRTALHDAALRGCSELVALLLQRAGDPLAVSLQEELCSTGHGMVPLQCAAHRGHETVVRQLLPVVLQATPAQATAVITSAAVAAARSSYTQVAVLLMKELGRWDPPAVAEVLAQLQRQSDDASGSAVLAALVLQWVADCAELPQQQEALRREQAELDRAQQRMQGMFLAAAGVMKELQTAETDM